MAWVRLLHEIAMVERSGEEAIVILSGQKSRYEEHHRVTYTDAALDAAVKLAARHLRDYRLPDSAIDLLDEAGSVARLAAPPTAPAARSDLPDLPGSPGVPGPSDLPGRPAPVIVDAPEI